jgi:hypothetical protein
MMPCEAGKFHFSTRVREQMMGVGMSQRDRNGKSGSEI